MRLSVLDLIPVRTDQTTSDALAATTRLAQTADRLGYTRYWIAEHHNMPAVAATSPPTAFSLPISERVPCNGVGDMAPRLDERQPESSALTMGSLTTGCPRRSV